MTTVVKGQYAEKKKTISESISSIKTRKEIHTRARARGHYLIGRKRCNYVTTASPWRQKRAGNEGDLGIVTPIMNESL